MLEILTQSAWAYRIGWVLVHSLWQFAAVGLLAVVLQRTLRRRSAAARYRALLAAMLLMALAPLATWFSPWAIDAPVVVAKLGPGTNAAKAVGGPDSSAIGVPQAQEVPGAWEASRGFAAPIAELSGPPAEPQRLQPAPITLASVLSAATIRLQPWLPEIVLLWLAGVLLAALRPLWSWHTVRRLRKAGVWPIGDAVRSVMERTANRLKVARVVEVLQSTLVKTPVVVGCFRPAILLPLCVVAGLPEPQLELILAHELAHIRRHDYLINLLQTLVETLFFYHPAVWWLSAQIRNERENCCDDMAMAALGSRADYGRALLAIEELRAAPTALSLAARGGSLLARIRRIAGYEPTPRFAGGASILCVILASIAVFAAVTWAAAPTMHKPHSTAAIALDSPVDLVGQVVDTDGKPVRGATVTFGYGGRQSNIPNATTDSQGFFHTSTRSKPPMYVGVEADGYATLRQRIVARQSFCLQLERACTIRGRVVDPKGSPLSGVDVITETHKHDNVPLFHAVTDQAGRFLWRNAPSGEIELSFCSKDGRWMIKSQAIPATGKEQVITMSPDMCIQGTVVDAESGRPIDKFHFYWGSPRGKAGTLVYTLSDTFVKGNTFLVRNNQPFDRKESLRIEADGYESATRDFLHRSGEQHFDIRLKKAKADQSRVVKENRPEKATAKTPVTAHVVDSARKPNQETSKAPKPKLADLGKFPDEPAAHAMFTRLIETLQKAHSLSYRCRAITMFKGRQEPYVQQYRVWLKKPNYCRIQSELSVTDAKLREFLRGRGTESVLVDDGTTFWIYWPKGRPLFNCEDSDLYETTYLNSYLKNPAASEKVSIWEEMMHMGGGAPCFDLSLFFGRKTMLQHAFDAVRDRSVERIAGQDCDKIEVVAFDEHRWTFWLSRTDGLPRKVEYLFHVNWVKNPYDQGHTEEWSDVRLNAEMPDSLFAWRPPKGWREWKFPRTQEKMLKPGTMAPDFKLTAADGKMVRLSDYRGHSVWLCFWAACPYPNSTPDGKPGGRYDLRRIQKLYQQYKDSGLIVLGYNATDDPKVAQETLRANGITFFTILDASAEARRIRARGYKINGYEAKDYLIDGSGMIVARFYDQSEDEEPFLAAAENALLKVRGELAASARRSLDARFAKLAEEVACSASRLFQAIREADYNKDWSKPKDWERFPAKDVDYCVNHGYPLWVKWVCNKFKTDPIVDVQLGKVFMDVEARPAVHFRLALKNGEILEGDLPFIRTRERGRGKWMGFEALDWHLHKNPQEKR